MHIVSCLEVNISFSVQFSDYYYFFEAWLETKISEKSSINKMIKRAAKEIDIGSMNNHDMM